MSPSKRRLAIDLGVSLLLAAWSGCGSETAHIDPLVDLGSSNTTPQATSLAVDSDFIYVSAPDGLSGFIQRVSKADRTVALLVERDRRTMEIALDGERVFFTERLGGPFAVDEAGGAATLVGVESDAVWGLAVDADRVYWTRWPTETMGSLESAAKDGSDWQAVLMDGARCLRIALDATHVYCGDQEGQVWAMPKPSGEPVHLGGGTNLADFLVVDDTYVYFTTGGIPDPNGRLNRVLKAGGDTEVLAELGDHPAGLTLRNGRLYVGTNDGIVSIATDGTDRRLLAGTEYVGNDVESDADGIYWISDEGGVYFLNPD